MNATQTVSLKRAVEASVVPVGTKVTLPAGETAHITQSLGGSYTVVVNGNMFRIEGQDADALGFEVAAKPTRVAGQARTQDEVERLAWETMKTCYDPEIPVNIVDLGLVYSCLVEPVGDGNTYKVGVKMTLTAPGCGMGPVIQQEVHNKVLAIEDVAEVNVELVWEPQWNQGMLTDAAKLQLGLF